MEDVTMVYFVHKHCGEVWRISRNASNILYCPSCKSKEGWEEIEDVSCTTNETEGKETREEIKKIINEELQLREQESLAFSRIKQKNEYIGWLRHSNYGRITRLKTKLDVLCVEKEQ